jgi:hypothetical protein
MKDTDKQRIKGQLLGLSTQATSFKALLTVPPPPVLAGMPPVPVLVGPALVPLTNALKIQSEVIDKLIKIVEDVVSKS